MSLINDMLRDLDQRNSNESPVSRQAEPGLRLAPAALEPTEKYRFRWLVWSLLGVAFLILVGFLVNLYWNYDARLQDSEDELRAGQLVPEVQDRVVTIEEAPVIEPQRVMEKIQLLQVLVSRQAAGPRIELQLSRPVEHLVESNGQTLSIRLIDTELVSVLPNLAELPLINAIDVSSDANVLTFTIRMAGAYSVQSYLLNRNQYSALMIDLFSQADKPADAIVAQEPTENEELALETAPASALTPAQEGKEEDTPAGAVQPTVSEPVFNKTPRRLSLEEQDLENSAQALSMLGSGKVDEGVALLVAFLERSPRAHHTREALAIWFISNGEPARAGALMDAGLKLAPDRLGFIKIQARILLRRGLRNTAWELLTSHSARAQGDQEFLSLLASLSQQEGRHEQAIRLYRVLLNKDSGQPQWLLGLAISLEASGLKEDALRAYRQAARVPGIDARLKQYADDRIRALK